MGLKSFIKGNRALALQRKGQKEEAMHLYEEAIADGLNDPRYLLPYALLLIRDGQYQKAKDFLVAHQRVPGMTPQQRTELLVYYATCCMRLGNVDKGISALEQQAQKGETGLLYQTLGYLYIEKYDLANKPDFSAVTADPAEAENTEAAGDAENAEGTEPAEDGAAEKPMTPEETWNAGVEKAGEFIRRSVEYDEEDSVCLDNMAQYIYRVQGDRAAAREWFEKALARKEGQIDTLYFLSRYDEEEGNRAAALAKMEKALEGRFSPLNYCSREMAEREVARLKGETV
jgi:tetratricopeptide (TPR) repeat protein